MFHTILTQPLFNLLLIIYSAIPGHDFGVAVIILTIIVRLILWPLVTRQLHSQKALQSIQPEVAKIKQKTKGDRQKETEMLMELYKEKGTNPFSSILPLLVQIPVFLALYSVLRHSLSAASVAKEAYQWVQNLGPVAAIIHHQVILTPYWTVTSLVALLQQHLVLERDARELEEKKV
jgi:YidC/Oxa1 family membrane protein insertase